MESRRAFLGSVAVAAALAGCTSGPGDSDGEPTDTESDSPTATDESMDSPTGTGGAEPDATVTVGPGGDLRFDPETLDVEVGASVEFAWDSGGHTVTVESQPDGADWEATGQSTEDAGFSHTHTFEIEGQYDYVCIPHESAGMVGTVLVGDVATATATPSENGGGGGDGYY